MADDLVKRLRDLSPWVPPIGVYNEAADELERLAAERDGWLADCEAASVRHEGCQRNLETAHGELARLGTENDRLREENAALTLRLERDAHTYATMQAGMESQAELADGLKQRCRVAENKAAGFDALVAVMGSFADNADAPDPTVESLLDWIGRAKVAEAEVARLRGALQPFADYAAEGGGRPGLRDVPDACPVRLRFGEQSGVSPTLGDCRAARAALAPAAPDPRPADLAEIDNEGGHP